MKVIADAIKAGASDIHITEGKTVAYRLNGEIVVQDRYGMIPRDIIVQFLEISTPERLGSFLIKQSEESLKVIDFAFTDEVTNIRVRGQAFRGFTGISLALRLLYSKIPEIHELRLPPSISKFTEMHDGLVIFTGATGSGKSTTLASIINQINKTRRVNILTIEDPIEYIHKDILSRVHQREIQKHSRSFADATVEALREDPDVIQVGEMRDLDTIENALIMAETGHLVFGTLHSLSVVDTIDRIVNVFPENKQSQIRFSLSNILRGVVSQRLIRSKSSQSRVPVCEVMMVDDQIANYIRKQQDKNSFRELIRTSKEIGSVHLVDNIIEHIRKGNITTEEAIKILDPDEMVLFNGVLGRR